MNTLNLAINKRQKTPLLVLFFDPINYNFLNNYTIEKVTSSTGSAIGVQDPKKFIGFMEYIYDNYTPCKVTLRENLIELDTMFLRFIVKRMIDGYKDYKKYHYDASTLAVPNDRPINSSSKGSKSLSENCIL